MKYFIFVLSFFFSNLIIGQITFEPTFINQCSNEVLQFQYWNISDSSKAYDFNLKKVDLPKVGNYQLKINFGSPINITINKNGIIRDTFFTKRITHNKQISNPSTSKYLDCDSLANGKISDYYFNGKIRMKGTFEKGQAIDTLFSYNRSGQLTEILIPNKKNWKKITYFKNGKIKSIYDKEKKYEKEFHPSGQLKKDKTWSRKNKITLKGYFPNGKLKRKQSHKKLEIYNEDKVVIEKMKRKEILIFERLFARKKHGKERFYKYKWESFDPRGIIKRKIIFDGDHFKGSPFPDSIQQINDFLFENTIFYLSLIHI